MSKETKQGVYTAQLLEGRSGQLFIKVISNVNPDICVIEKIESQKRAVQKLRELERAMA